jgi:mannose/fructose/N-acetylgalactosamine-specific phosphotransferase system component IID
MSAITTSGRKRPSFAQRVATDVVLSLIAVAFFAANYWLARHVFGANPSWAAGFAVVLSVVGAR